MAGKLGAEEGMIDGLELIEGMIGQMTYETGVVLQIWRLVRLGVRSGICAGV